MSLLGSMLNYFFFSSRRRHTRSYGDWSSDVCSSDLDFGHQLRNQLNAIVGAAGLLSATATSSDQRELASVVLTGSEELAGLVDEVLDSPLIQSGEFELALHPFNVRGSVESCLARLAGIAGSKGINPSFHAADDVPRVIVGDSRRLEQVLHSL